MVEYYVDVRMNNALEQWMIDQGAQVSINPRTHITSYGKEVHDHPIVMFGGRQVHFYPGSSEARIFFNEGNETLISMLIMLYDSAIIQHNFYEHET